MGYRDTYQFTLHCQSEFRNIGDQAWKNALAKNRESYTRAEDIREYIKLKEPLWKDYEKRVFDELSGITSLKWKEEKIICYTVGFCRPFSDPLTIMPFDSDEHFIDTLIHELIHQIFTQNPDKIKGPYNFFKERYHLETTKTFNHIVLYAVYFELYKRLFNDGRLEQIKARLSDKDYTRAWEIVEKYGYNNIIKDFLDHIG